MRIYYRIMFSLMLLLAVEPAFSIKCSFLPGKPDEKLILFTDRSIYITGEQIQFSASIFISESTTTAIESRIFYCELVTPDGSIISNYKYLFTNSVADGCFKIPDNLLTGVYYIRGYTKVMRSYGPQFYEYRQIRIINPDNLEVFSPDNSQDTQNQQFTEVKENEKNDLLLISVEKSDYKPRDTISLSYKQADGSPARIKSMCLSVVPENSKSYNFLQTTASKKTITGKIYYPETRGLSLAGKLTEASSSEPVVDKKINLSIIGQGRDFMVARSDTAGQFFFALPDYYKSRDLFLCAERTPSKAVKIWVDNDFCTAPIRLPSPEFSLTEQERATVLAMAQNMKISSHFSSIKATDSLTSTKKMNAFYGKPTTILYIDKYIQLPSLEEYFNELPSQVKVRKRKGESYFAVQGSTEVSIYDPLVLIDWVAVDEPAKILALSPQNIERIEVVNEDYVKGAEIYGGIISIISRKSDFAGIDLPSTGIFVNFHMLADTKCVNKEEYYPANHPDARNTILWKPSLTGQKKQYEKIIFTAPDTPGKYNAIFEGVTMDGEVFSVTSEFEVTN